jgi:nucleoside-diphosphate kinase
MYADSIEKNIVHGSDSVENAKNEIAHFFKDADLV